MPSQDLDFHRHCCGFTVCNDLKWEVVVHFLYIGDIFDHLYSNFLFILITNSGLGLWCLMPLSTISVTSWWRKPEKTTDLPLVTDKLIMLYRIQCLSGIHTHNVSGDMYRIAEVVVNVTTIRTRWPPSLIQELVIRM